MNTRNISVRKERRARRTRAKIFGTSSRPRLSVSRSNKALYAQLIDDEHGQTVLHASSKKIGTKKGTKVFFAEEVGKVLAEEALKKGIKAVVFDKGSYAFHGRVKALAEGARKAGLKF